MSEHHNDKKNDFEEIDRRKFIKKSTKLTAGVIASTSLWGCSVLFDETPGGNLLVHGDCDIDPTPPTGLTTLFFENFEDGDFTTNPAWTNNRLIIGSCCGTTYNVNVISPGANATSNSLEMDDTCDSVAVPAEDISQSFSGGISPTYVSFYAQSVTPSGPHGWFVLRYATTDIFTFNFGPSTSMYVNGTDTGIAYSTSTWHRIEFRNINWSGGTFELYIDNAFVSGITTFANSASSVDSLHLFVGNGGHVRFDEIELKG